MKNLQIQYDAVTTLKIMTLDTKKQPHISVAPMMDWTDRHFRYFMRLIAPQVRLYTEMVTTGALLHADPDRFLRFDTSEHPIALQLGGSDPRDLALCAKMGEAYGYDEINLNCGCPSDRVQKGKIGAILMTEPDLVAQCVKSMQNSTQIPISIKCRIGVDDFDDAAFLYNFVEKNVDIGCKTFIIHARKAWLKGLSPKQNREIPELNYQRVYDLKAAYPDLEIILNGGLITVEAAQSALKYIDGVMIGREAYHNPFFMAELERGILGTQTEICKEQIAIHMAEYAQKQYDTYQTPVKSITRHILGLYHQQKGAKAWRRTLSTLPYQDNAGPDVIEKALAAVKAAQSV